MRKFRYEDILLSKIWVISYDFSRSWPHYKCLKRPEKRLKNPARYKMKHGKWLRINTKRFKRTNWETKPPK